MTVFLQTIAQNEDMIIDLNSYTHATALYYKKENGFTFWDPNRHNYYTYEKGEVSIQGLARKIMESTLVEESCQGVNAKPILCFDFFVRKDLKATAPEKETRIGEFSLKEIIQNFYVTKLGKLPTENFLNKKDRGHNVLQIAALRDHKDIFRAILGSKLTSQQKRQSIQTYCKFGQDEVFKKVLGTSLLRNTSIIPTAAPQPRKPPYPKPG